MTLTDDHIWNSITRRAGVGDDEVYLRLSQHELKRNVWFLRVPEGIELPTDLTVRLTEAAVEMGYRFRITAKWATMSDLNLAVGEVNWLWEDWIPKEMVTILAGEPGTGKSQLALWFCKVVTEGLIWPNGARQERGKAIYVDAESAQVITKERSLNMGMDTDMLFVPNLGNDMLTQPDLNEASHRDQLAQMVEEVKPSLVIVDSLGGAKSGGENRKEEVQPTMLYLTRLVQGKECALVILHHLNKTKREEDEEIAMAHLRGSTAISQFARSILFLSKKPKGIKLWVGKSNIAKLAAPMEVSFIEEPFVKNGKPGTIVRGFEFEPWRDDVKTTKFDECMEWCLRTLSGFPNHAVAFVELKELLKEEPYTLHLLKDVGHALETKGVITRTGGKYSVWSLLQMGIPGMAYRLIAVHAEESPLSEESEGPDDDVGSGDNTGLFLGGIDDGPVG